MDRNTHLRELEKKYGRRRLMKRFVALLCVAVMLLTMNGLKFNADTLERKPACGLSEHVHTDGCYQNGLLTCEKVEHTHTDACYQQRPASSGAVAAESVEADVDEVDFQLGGESAAANDAPEAGYTCPLGATALLSELVRETGMPVDAAEVDAISLAHEDEAGLVALEKTEGDYRISALVDFDAIELIVHAGERLFAVVLTGGVAQAIEAPEQEASEEGQPVEEPPVDGETAETQPTTETPVEEEPETEEPVVEEPVDVKPIDEEPAVGEPVVEEPVTEEPVTEEPVDEEPVDEEPVVEEPADEEPVDEEPVDEKPVVEEPADEEPVDEEPTDEEPADEEPVVEEPVVEELVDEEPVTEEPVDEEPVTEEPVDEEPVAEEPVDEEPITEEPVDEEPVTEEPITEEPVDEEPVTEEPVTEEPVDEEPVTEEPITEEPVDEELVTEEPVTEEPVDEEPVDEEPVTEEPVTEEPVDEEPVDEEPVTEEPVDEEPVTEEPVDEEPVAEPYYPAVVLEGGTQFVSVSVSAPEGAFPEGVTMSVKDVWAKDTRDAIREAVEEDFVEVQRVQAVDITFYNAEGEAIEPLAPISVVLSTRALDQAQDAVIVHVDDAGEASVVDAEAGEGEVAFEADAFSVYAVVVTRTIETKYIDAAGTTWNISVGYGQDAEIPAGTQLKVEEVPAEDYIDRAESALEDREISLARFFDITLVADGEEVQPKSAVTVNVRLADEAEGEAQALHFAQAGVEVLETSKQNDAVVFEATGFSVYGVVYTVDFEVEGDRGEITLDFEAFDATTLPEAGEIYYDTADCGVHVTLGLLANILRGEAEAGYDIDTAADLVEGFAFDFDSAEPVEPGSGVRFAEGELVIESDGAIELTDGQRRLAVTTKGLTALKQALLETEGASIEVISGNVPLGSEASYTAHTQDETAELVENYIYNEETGDSGVAGYSAADLKIVRNAQTLPVEGQFRVTVDKASLVPVGMKLEKLYHIHRDENDEAVVEELAFEETEAGLVFELANFSDIVAGYTVDFEYNGYKWSFPGLGSYSIASIMEEIGVEGEITHVSLKLVEGEEVEGALYLEEKEDGWYLTSDVAFDETYELTVVVDGLTYVITVTDDQKLTQINVTFKNINGNVDTDARLDGKYYVAFNKWIDKNYAWASPIDLQDGVANISVGQNLLMTAADGKHRNNSGDLYIDPSNVQIYKFSGEKTDLEKSIAAYNTNGKIENGASIGKYVLTRGTSINEGIYEFTFNEQPAYDIDVYFKDADGNPSIPSDKYFVFASVNKEYTNNGVSTTGVYHTVQGPLSFDNDGHASVFITQFKRNNANPSSYPYKADDDITVYLVKNQDNNFVGNNENDRGTITAGEVVTNGSMVGGYSFTVTSQEGKTTFVGQIPQTMNYTVKVVDANGVDKGSAPDLNNKQWFIQATVNRDDGSYIATARIDNAFSGDTATGSFNALHRKTGTSSSLSTAYRTGEDVSFALLRAKDGGDHNWEYFADTSHINTNAMSGSSVESKYTLHVDQEHHVLTLQEAPAASIVLTAHSGMETTDALAAPILDRTQSGKYYIAGEMFVQDGTVSYNGYALEQYNTASATQTMAVTEGLKAYTDENKWQAEYVTGKRFIDPILVYVSNSANLNDADAIRNAIKDKNSSVEIYRDGEAVEGYKLVVEKQAQLGDETDATVAKMHLVKLPTLTVTGVWDGAVDSANDYYTLTELKRGEVTAYALTPFSTSETGINCFEDASGNKVYYQDGDTIDNYMVKVAKGTSLTQAQAIAKSAGTRYTAGQMMGGYTPAFAVEDTAITTTLKPVSTTGLAHDVSVQLYDKDNVALSAADPTIGGDYYVLAYLTAKGDPNKQVVAWTVNQVGMGSDQVTWPNGVETHTTIDGLNTKGVYAYTIPASTGFKALDSDLNNTGDTLGFDPALYDLNLRMYTNGYYNVQDINALTYSGIRENFDDSAPGGYDYVTPEIGADASQIKLRQAYEKEYRLRVDVDELGLEIKDSDKYIVRVKLVHHSNNQVSYAFAKLVVDKENKSTYLDFYGEEKNGKFYYWRDGNCAIQENIYITGNEKATQLDVILLANPIENSALGNLKNEPLSSNDGSVIPVGESINMYSLSFGKRETVDEHQPGTQTYKTIITDVIKFNVDNGDISKGDIDSYLETATNFGLYTENLSVHGTDMESNIGAHELTGQIGADYGFSGNNVQVNRVKVVKKYEGASAGTSVTLKLYPVVSENDDGSYVLGEGISQTVNTNGEGIAVFEYKGLISGTYVLKEVVGNKEYGYDDGENGFVNVDSSNLVIDFNEKELVIKNINVNVNYFGSIAGDVDVSAVIGHSRHGVIVTDDQNSYERLLHANGNVNDGTLGSVYKAGSEQHPTKYNIPADMDSLRVLSQRLGTAVSSRTVRIINKKLSELNSAEYLNLNDDGRYIVVNVDVTGEGSTVGFNPMTKINGVTLRADFGQEGSEYASRVLYNFITRDAHGNVYPYTGHIDTTKEGSGVLLAPSAVVGNLAANWGGTIICHEAQHTGSEIHSDSANKIQNINTVLTNRTSDAKKGNLELQKNIFGESMDHTTWFTFEVTMYKANGDPAANETFVASGLRDKDATSVTFDENGVLRVQVRAQNKVLITGIPEGYTYTVKEIRTVETAHYQLVQLVDAAGEVYDENTATYQTSVGGTIAENTTDVVQAINAHKVGGLTVGKTVVGDETREKKFTFRVTLYNAQGEVDTAINRYYGGMSFVNGVAEFQLGNGEFKTAKKIPTGTKFTVEEISANSDGFVTSVNVTALVPAEQEDKTPSVDTASSVVSGEIIEDGEGNKIAIITAYKNTHYEGTKYTPKVTKRLVTGSGAEADDALWPADGFTFTITPAQNNLEGVSPTENFGTAKATVASKTAVFGALTFVYNESDVWDGNRTYTYTIAEVIPDDAVNTDNVKYSEATEKQKATGVWKLNGITYSAKPVNLTVEVGPQDEGDNATLLEIKRATYKYSDGTVISDGILNPSGTQVTVEAAEGVAENLYTKPTGALTITKQVTVNSQTTDTSLADGTYTFTITDSSGKQAEGKVDGNAITDGKVTLTITGGVSQSVKVTDLTPDVYTVTEDAVSNGTTLTNVTGDGTAGSVERGIKLTVVANDTAAANVATFTNNKPYTTAHPQVTKAVTATGYADNVRWPDNVAFGFVLQLESAKADGKDIDFNMADQTKTASKADKIAVFDDIAFTEPGVYTFTLTEQKPQNAPTYITYDTEPKTVTVTVTADGNGNLTPAVSYGGAGTLTVNNVYTANGTAQFSARKTANDQLGDRTFQFQLLDGNDNVLQTSTAVTQGQTATFTAISYDLSNLTETADGKRTGTFTYKIKEVIPNDAQTVDDHKVKDGVIYDETVHTVTVTVTDTGNGTLDVKYNGSDTFTVPDFNNTYDASGKTTFDGVKEIVNRQFKDGDRLSVSISSSDGGKLPSDANGKTVALTASQNTASFSFAEVEYTYDDIKDSTATPKSKTFHYTVTETATMDGTTADTRTHTIEVTVTDNGDGTLKVEKVYKADTASEDKTRFMNTFDTSIKAQIKGAKAVTNGGADKSGYRFALAGENGAPTPETTTATSAEDGSFGFGEVTYTMSMVKAGNTAENGVYSKTYTYTVTELLPEGADAATTEEQAAGKAIRNNIQYDIAPKTVTVTVTYDETTGAMTQTVSPSQAEFVITNEKLGELDITKNITVNGMIDPSRTGTFWYAVYKAADVENGAPKKDESGNINVKPATDANGHSLVGSITVTENGTETVTVDKLPYGDYYVFELTGEPTTDEGPGVKLIVNKTDGAYTTIGGTVYHVTYGSTSARSVGTTAGQATIDNDVPETSITGKKTWKPYTSDLGDRKNPVNTTLTLTLTRYTVNGNEYQPDVTFGDHQVTISTDANGDITRPDGTKVNMPDLTTSAGVAAYEAAWSYTWDDLPLYGNSTDVRYVYKVDETVDNDWFSRQAGENSGYLPGVDGNTTQEFNNVEKSPVSLPATGGVGTGIYYGAGIGLLLLAVLGLILGARKRARDGID